MKDLTGNFRFIDWKDLQKSVCKVQASSASALVHMVMTDLENKILAAITVTSKRASGTSLTAVVHGI